MSPQAEDVKYDELPSSAGHGVHMFAGALVSSAASSTPRKTLPQRGKR